MGRSLRLPQPACHHSHRNARFASLGISASSAGILSIPEFYCSADKNTALLCNLGRCPVVPPAEGTLLLAQPPTVTVLKMLDIIKLQACLPPVLYPLPVCRWCSALTACSGIPVSTCLVMSAPPQRVGVNCSSSGTSTKVKKAPFVHTYAVNYSMEQTLTASCSLPSSHPAGADGGRGRRHHGEHQ